jgi:transcription elongation factor GreB
MAIFQTLAFLKKVADSYLAETEEEDEESLLDSSLQIPAGTKNYITPAGFKRLQDELDQLWKIERPTLVQTITWAASNGDRSENGDYIYGKKRLREIDKRIRFLAKRLENAEVIDPATRKECDQIFFGATVTVCGLDGEHRTFSIVGVDEAVPARGLVSWVSPLARALLKAREDETVTLRLPTGVDELQVISVAYCSISLDE